MSKCRTPILFVIALSVLSAARFAQPLGAQAAPGKAGSKAATKAGAKPSAKPSGKTAAPLSGVWVGTASVPLGDSTIVVPVTYSFTETAGTIGGTAMVPGQGSGPISNVVQDGPRVQFRVTAPEARLLEHDGRIGADGSIEGMVNMNNQPVAKFRITANKPEPTRK
ncbi:MAG: hypothetical protein V4617_16075 [Gemmatimonadota bacterium]